jgi:hypothetical protein
VAVEYDPSQTEEYVDNFLATAFSQIPIIGNLNLGLPKPGEVMHVVRFKTIDEYGFIRVGEFNFTWGSYQDGDRIRMGPVNTSLVVYKSVAPQTEVYEERPEESTGIVPLI